MENLIEKINKTIEVFKVEVDKNLKGNKAAGRRARVISLELGNLLKEYRKVSMETNK